MFVANQRGLRDQDGILELVLDRLRSDQFAAGGFEQLLFAIGDVEKSIVVEVGDIAGAKPAFHVEALGVGCGLVPVAEKTEGPRTSSSPSSANLSSTLDIGFPTEPMRCDARSVERDHGRSFSEAIALPNGDARRGKPLRRIDAKRCAAGDKDLDTATEGFPHLAVDQACWQASRRMKKACAGVNRCRGVVRLRRIAQARMRLLNRRQTLTSARLPDGSSHRRAAHQRKLWGEFLSSPGAACRIASNRRPARHGHTSRNRARGR